MRRGFVLSLLAAAGVALLYLAAVEVAIARAAPGPLELGLEAREREVARGLASSMPELRSSPSPVALVVLAGPRALPDAERDALRAHVEGGGELWILSSAPSERALWDDPALKAVAFQGTLYGAEGGAPRLNLSDYGELRALGFLALDLGPAYRPLLTADGLSFRDTNGNGRLDTGEPGGPFPVGAFAPVGENGGRVVVVGAEDASLLPQALASGLSRELREGRAILVDPESAPAWAGPGVAFLALVALPTGGLLAPVLTLAAGAGVLLLALPRAEDRRKDAAAAAKRLADAYADRLRERGRPEDRTLLQSLQGDTAP